MSVMPETSQAAVGPYIAVAAVRLALNARTAVFREAVLVKVPGAWPGGDGHGSDSGDDGNGGEGGGDGGNGGAGGSDGGDSGNHNMVFDFGCNQSVVPRFHACGLMTANQSSGPSLETAAASIVTMH